MTLCSPDYLAAKERERLAKLANLANLGSERVDIKEHIASASVFLHLHLHTRFLEVRLKPLTACIPQQPKSATEASCNLATILKTYLLTLGHRPVHITAIMRSFTTLALGFAGLAAFASASDVHDLNKDTFTDFVKENDLVLAECK